MSTAAGATTRKPPAVTVVEAICAAQWAMSEEYLRTMVEIASREHEVTIEALEAYRSRRITDAAGHFAARGSVAVITAQGPMFRYADFFSSISGATTYENLALDVTRARDDPAFRAVLLNIDSPGGEVNGVQELAAMIREVDASKPVVAYVSGAGTSAAYLLASAAREIVVAPNAVLGSIGVRSAVRDSRARDERSGIRTIEFVSSQSPNKLIDVDSDAGRARIQRTVDALAEVFIRQVADYRGISPEQVISQFGAGGVEIGERAIAAGMADRLGSFEGIVADLGRAHAGWPAGRGTRGASMTTTAAAPSAVTDTAQASAIAEAVSTALRAANERHRAILALDSARGREDMARALALDTTLPVAAADALLRSAPPGAQPAAAAAAAPPGPAAVPAPAIAGAARSSAQPGGLLNAEPVAPAKAKDDGWPSPAKLAAIYAKFGGAAA